VLINDKIVATIHVLEMGQNDSTKVIIPIEIGLNAREETYAKYPDFSSVLIQAAKRISLDDFFSSFLTNFVTNLEHLRNMEY
jgi:hypothetical protein